MVQMVLKEICFNKHRYWLDGFFCDSEYCTYCYSTEVLLTVVCNRFFSTGK